MMPGTGEHSQADAHPEVLEAVSWQSRYVTWANDGHFLYFIKVKAVPDAEDDKRHKGKERNR